MKIIYNNFLPFPGFSAMMFCGVIFARRKYKPLPAIVVHHEEIHRAQAKDCGGYLFYYIRYIGYWLKYGYRKNPFEVEAYLFQTKRDYLKSRQPKAWKQLK